MDKRWIALLLAVFFFPAALAAQEPKPILCGTDTEGGLPYIVGSKDDPDSFIGFEVELMDALAKELGKPIVRKHASFDSLISSVERGDVDFAMNGLEITPDNLRQARFTRPYYIYQLQLIARIDDHRFTTLQDCKDKGLIISTQSGSAAHRLLTKEGIEVAPFDDQDGPFHALVNKQVDGVLFDMPIALYYVVPDNEIEHRKKDFRGLKLVGSPFAEGYYGLAIKKDNVAFANELDAALGRVIQSGELKRILTKWHLWSPDQYRLYTPLKSDDEAAAGLGFFYYFWILLNAAGVTVLLTISSMMLAVALGLPIATLRLYGPLPLQWLAIGFVEFFRGIPVLLLLFFLYFGLPKLGVSLDPFTAAVLGFGLNYAAYEAEIYRNGIQAVPIGQWEAGASLGMSPFLTFRRIVFPQSIRVILPPMTNDFIALFKDTSVVSVVSVIELSKRYQILTKTYGEIIQIGLITATLYLIMSVPFGHLSRYLEKRWGAK